LPSYLPLGPGLPEFAVEIAFASLPTDATQTWTNVSPFVRALSIRRGRQDELARVETGTLNLLLDNRDARFNPENTSSPYYPNLVPKRQVRVLARSGATTATLFTGFVGGFPQGWPDAGTDSVVRLGAVDLMGLLARARLSSQPLTRLPNASITDSDTTLIVTTPPAYWPTSFTYTITFTGPDNGGVVGSEDMTVTAASDSTHLTVIRGANNTTPRAFSGTGGSTITTLANQYTGLSGAVLTAIITNALWAGLSIPGGYFNNIATGLTTCDTGIITADNNPFELAHQVADSESGLFFAGVDGLPVFHDRHYRMLLSTVTGTFGEISPEIPYQDIGVSHDEGQLYNYVVITALGGQQLTATDATSAAAYWPQTLPRTTIGLPGEAQDLADYLLSRFKDPQLRVPDLVLDGHTVAGSTLVGLDLDQRYTVKRRPATGTVINKDGFVEGVTHTLAPAEWTTTLNLSPADMEEYWVLGTSELGISTRLAY
jgi:hypothetical protein